jgi:hypothetical protein
MMALIGDLLQQFNKYFNYIRPYSALNMEAFNVLI